ncbi:hypothetical protein Q5752_002687 [Cryptotrichosporon argae]
MSSPAPLPVLVPPINFALVAPGLYRSGHPNRKNFGYLATLGLRSVLYLERGEYRKDGADFVEQHGAALFRFDLSDEDALFTPAGQTATRAALRAVLDTRNHPLLIHDDTGKAAATVLCALVRRCARWSLTGIYAEADMFAGAAGSEGGGLGMAAREYVALFVPADVGADPAHLPVWI